MAWLPIMAAAYRILSISLLSIPQRRKGVNRRGAGRAGAGDAGLRFRAARLRLAGWVATPDMAPARLTSVDEERGRRFHTQF